MTAQIRPALPVHEQRGSVQPVQAGCRPRGVHRRTADHRGDVIGEQIAARTGRLEREERDRLGVPEFLALQGATRRR